MNRFVLRAGAVALAGLVSGLVAGPVLAADHDALPDSTTATSRDVDDDALLLQLAPEASLRAGLRLERASASQFTSEVLAYGRVLDPAPVVAAVGHWRSARAQAERADQELRRIEKLARDEQNASTRDLELARAVASAASADRELAEAQVVGLLGADLVNDPRLTSWARAIARRSAALIRVDVPASRAQPEPARGARLTSYPDEGQPIASEYLGPAPAADSQLPGWGFLFLVPANPPPSGTPIRARIRTAEEIQQGVELASEALVRHDGALFVFVKRGDGLFERRAVMAQARGDGRWFVTGGVQPEDEVVVSGAQQLLSAQILAATPTEDD